MSFNVVHDVRLMTRMYEATNQDLIGTSAEREDYPNRFVLYSVTELCTATCNIIKAVLKVSWIIYRCHQKCNN